MTSFTVTSRGSPESLRPQMLKCASSLATDGLCAESQTRAGVFHPPERIVQRKELMLLHHIHPVKETLDKSCPGIVLEF